MPKILISDLNKRSLFPNFTLYSKGRYFSITRFDILIFCNILHVEMNFGSLYRILIKVSEKRLVKRSINKKSKKTK